MAPPIKRHTYANQLQGCNFSHILCGLISIALAGTQFSAIRIENYNQIDFRLLNWIHVVTGGIGMFMIRRNYGSIAAKCLYHISATLGVFTAAFYAYTITVVVNSYKQFKTLSELPGGEEYIDERNLHVGKIAVCAIMIAIGIIELGVSAFSIIFLDKLASDVRAKPKSRDLKNRGRIGFIGVMKLFLGFAILPLGAYLEHLYIQQEKYLKIGWHELAAAFLLCSGLADLMALYLRHHNRLNLKVSLVLSIASAVFTIKTMDFMMAGYFFADLSAYTGFDENNFQSPTLARMIGAAQSTGQGQFDQTDPARQEKRLRFIKFIVHASIIGGLSVAFIHCVISAVEAGAYMERTSEQGTSAMHEQTLKSIGLAGTVSCIKNCLGILQAFLGLALIALVIISLVPWEFSDGYIATDILWLGVLLVAAGLVNSSRLRTMSTAAYIMSTICSIVSLEHLLYSINMIYQSTYNVKYDSNTSTVHSGRITLYSIQTGILLVEFLVSTYIAVRFSHIICRLPLDGGRSGSKPHNILGVLTLIHILYAIVAIGVNIASAVAIWKYRILNIPSFVNYLYGPVVFIVGIVQLVATSSAKYLLPCSLLQIVSASISFFVLAPATTNLYYLVTVYRQQYASEFRNSSNLSTDEESEKLVMEVIIGLTAAVIVIAMMEYAASCASAMHASYLLHHRYASPNGSDARSLRFSTLQSHGPAHHYFAGSDELVPHPSSKVSPAGHASSATAPSIYGVAQLRNGNYRNGHANSSAMVNANTNGYAGNINGYNTGNGAGYNTGTGTGYNTGTGTGQASRYFGNDFRIYSTNRMYNPEDVIFKTNASTNGNYGNSNANYGNSYGNNGNVTMNGAYGYVHTNRMNNYAQTNVRHMFSNNNPYLSAYNN